MNRCYSVDTLIYINYHGIVSHNLATALTGAMLVVRTTLVSTLYTSLGPLNRPKPDPCPYRVNHSQPLNRCTSSSQAHDAMRSLSNSAQARPMTNSVWSWWTTRAAGGLVLQLFAFHVSLNTHDVQHKVAHVLHVMSYDVEARTSAW
jgi:hypothetical protein